MIHSSSRHGTLICNKRHANSVIKSALGRIKSACECRVEHIKTLKAKLSSAQAWLKKAIDN